MAEYLIAPAFPGCERTIPVNAVKLIAVFVLTTITVLNIYSVPWSYRVEIFLDVTRLSGLLMIVLMGITRLAQGHTDNFQGAFTSSVDLSSLPLAFYSGMWAYSGWQLMPAIIEEVVNPARNIPLAIIISMAVVTGVYIFTNVAYFSVLSADQLLASDAVASDFAIPILGDWAWIVQILVGLSCLGNRVGTTFSSARIMFIGSREGVLPELFSMISIRRLTPSPAIIALHILSVIMVFPSNIYSLINYLSFANWLFVAVATSIVPYYRWKYPDLPRPYKVPLICPILFVICALSMVALSLYSAPIDCGIGLAMVLSAIPVYLICVLWKGKPQCIMNALTHSTHFFQKLLVVIHQEAKTY
ncbi:cystine/glutamate transporter-like [Amphiura filiformis]|uniref:cystine/glutamate transporter-like n=1 Tax=Amphiura filiformis TaxID=82378 RepID=UPI003B20CFDF